MNTYSRARVPARRRTSSSSIAVDTAKLLLLGLLFLAIFVGAYMVTALLVMIAVGMIHALWIVALPTMGYHTALALAWIPGVIFGAGHATSSRSGK